MEWLSILLFGIFIVAVYFGAQKIGELIGGSDKPGSAYSKQQKAEWEERARQSREIFEAANPDSPPISETEHSEFAQWLGAQSKPAIRLDPAGSAPEANGQAGPDGSRLGGPVWLEEGQAWPQSRKGNPMEFIAQLDFNQLPELEGFPTTGALQFFIPDDDDLWGMEMDEPIKSDVAVLYRPEGSPRNRHQQTAQRPPDESITPFLNETVRQAGVALAGAAIEDVMPSNIWELDARIEGNLRRPGFERWDDLIEANEEKRSLVHHAGGYPCFVQSDFRGPGSLDDYDTVLLRLTSDDHLQWGDVGEAHFLIRSADLAARDFSKVIFWWDCS
ncbi:DUF1963 domain-containing protein [Erythrobacter insulae]|uniref:DUF1963 domain-containing protein n=1 Tax=Erythrobacter insulae TaxID=2584124 RepID=A0A547PC45_9SPHN|nr:YwqG family protein [Erythrobacter insulae]TRD11712.1 DUF1963 domain-containing protein [Erythrobacter insulae]